MPKAIKVVHWKRPEVMTMIRKISKTSGDYLITDKRQKINYAKNELKNYMYLLNVCQGFEDKILKLETQLEGIKSPSNLIDVRVLLDESTRLYHRNELMEKLQRTQKGYTMFRCRVDKIQDFLAGLEYEERKIITDVYINNVRMIKVATELYCDKKTLERRIDKIFTLNW